MSPSKDARSIPVVHLVCPAGFLGILCLIFVPPAFPLSLGFLNCEKGLVFSFLPSAFSPQNQP
uniref:Uncharacterized protein n=1 Tax=Solanum lycopersicum TaxID=4081 RepID=A0A3Q7IGI0_SOLLC